MYLLNTPKNFPSIPPYGVGSFNNIDDKAGLKDIAFIEETITETTIVKANC